jgi:hypothetical protein
MSTAGSFGQANMFAQKKRGFQSLKNFRIDLSKIEQVGILLNDDLPYLGFVQKKNSIDSPILVAFKQLGK